MAVKNKKGKYLCSYCGKEYAHPEQADSCRDEHDLIYIPISKKELNALNHFLTYPRAELLEQMPNIINNLRRAQKVKASHG